MIEALEHAAAMRDKFSEVVDILKRPTSQGIVDLIQWIERNGRDFEYDFDDLLGLIEHHMEQQAIHGQLHLNHELTKDAGMRIGA